MDHRKDYAFLSDDPTVESHDENFYSGALSFCRRPYTRDVAPLDVAVMGVPYDVSVTNRPGTRFGPRAVRAASTNLAWARAWPSSFDPFQRLKVGDWGDIHIDNGHPEKVPAHIEAAIASVLAKDTATLLIGGDHFSTYPLWLVTLATPGSSLYHHTPHLPLNLPLLFILIVTCG